RRDGLGKALRCVPLAMLTVLVAVTWYLPAWIAASGDGPIGTVARHLPMTDKREWSPVAELGKVGIQLGEAWPQWVWPLRGNASLLVLIPIGVSILVGLVRGQAVGILAAGILVGPVTVLAITGFGSPPWWTMVWIPPVLIVIFAAGFPWPSRSNRTDEHGGSIGSSPPLFPKAWAVVAIILAASAVFSTSPERFARDYPNRVWIEDAGPLVAWLIEQDLEVGSTIATGTVHGPVRYELHRRFGLLNSIGIAEKPIESPRLPLRLLSSIPADDSVPESDRQRFLPGGDDLVLVDRRVVEGVLVRLYDLPVDR
ncbi:MAG: hypothetical protein GY895_21125, partial [Phycisphaera sp.]|nr:hypothetical protein [Phycisphaera sp.]